MDVFNYFFLLNRMTIHNKTIYRVLAMVEKFYYILVIGMCTAIRLPCCGPVTSRKFICNPDVTDYVGFRLTYPRSDRLLTNSIAGRDIHPREYVNNTASLRHFIVISLVPIVIVASYIYKCSLIYYCKSYID